jgi:hypothetical protein
VRQHLTSDQHHVSIRETGRFARLSVQIGDEIINFSIGRWGSENAWTFTSVLQPGQTLKTRATDANTLEPLPVTADDALGSAVVAASGTDSVIALQQSRACRVKTAS